MVFTIPKLEFRNKLIILIIKRIDTMLNLDEVIEFKNYLAENNAANIHLHDTCGGQYFTIDSGDDLTVNLIKDFLSKKNQQFVFAADKLSFTIISNKKFY